MGVIDDLRHRRIRRGFRIREPWVTRFTVDGRTYGGEHALGEDPRLAMFQRCFPDAGSILELGSLEGGHTFALAARPGARVVAVEGRAENVERAEFVARVLGVGNVTFVEADLEARRPSSFGTFDAVFCCGLLYHLPRPWELLDDLRHAAPGAFLWTHYAADDRATEVVEGLPGLWYQEYGREDPLSGLSPRSYWITLPALVGRLHDAGFGRVEVLADDRDHPHGPCVTLAAWAY